MKCPKCGYNSFEYHSICKRCSADFSAYKQTYNITSLVMPPEAREKKAEEFRNASSAGEQHVESVETDEEMFSFDMPGDVTSPPADAQRYDPFNFDEDIVNTVPQQTTVAEKGLLDPPESTSKAYGDPFAQYATASSTPSAEKEFTTLGPDEFDLENFSWDDTPAPTAESGGRADTDEFDSIFGEPADSTKK